jgi:hypothetical protein
MRSAYLEADLADFDDEEITDEFFYRFGDHNLVDDALESIKKGRYLDAQTALERLRYPKWNSRDECQAAYAAAMLGSTA